jgi:hypothetical protein
VSTPLVRAVCIDAVLCALPTTPSVSTIITPACSPVAASNRRIVRPVTGADLAERSGERPDVLAGDQHVGRLVGDDSSDLPGVLDTVHRTGCSGPPVVTHHGSTGVRRSWGRADELSIYHR